MAPWCRNFFDNAEMYGDGHAEEVLGRALKASGYPRSSYVVATKVSESFLEPALLEEHLDASLKRMGLDYIDLYQIHALCQRDGNVFHLTYIPETFDVEPTEDFPEVTCRRCGGGLKPDVVFFGENVPPAVTAAAWELYGDAEVLLVHPTTGRIYLVTKESRSPQVFRFPQNPGEGVLERVAVLSEERLGLRLPKLTGGDFSREGDRVILRGYLSAWEWAVQPSDPEAHWSKPPLRSVPLRLERQGEALTFDLTGRVFTSSEGSPMPLTRIGCRD